MIWLVVSVVLAIVAGWRMCTLWERDEERRKREAAEPESPPRPLREGYNPPPCGPTPEPPPICPKRCDPIIVNPAMLLHPEPGDVLVMAVRGHISQEHYERLKKDVETMLDQRGLKGKVSVMVIEDGAGVELRKKPEAK